MVAKIVSGKSIRGVLNYNERKVQQAEAQLLMACGFPRDPAELSFHNKLDRFEMLTRQNVATRTNALHISLNFSNRDRLDEDMLKSIAGDYMRQIGFGDQPYLVYQHFDAAHPHIHIATVNIAEGGSRIETHNIGRHQSEAARKKIEGDYGLIKAEDQQKDHAYQIKPVDLGKVIYGKAETKMAISNVVREVVSSYKFTSLPELNAALHQFGVVADRGSEGSRMYEKGGLLYTLVNAAGERVGIPVKASAIYTNPTLKNLEKKYAVNSSARKPYAMRLKHQLDKVLEQSRNVADLQDHLQRQGIRVLLRENVRGEVYGVTYIDNATRAVFNGSDLGKEYSAKAVQEKLAGIGKPRVDTTAPMQTNPTLERPLATTYPAQDQPAIETILDIAFAHEYEENIPDPFRKRKRRRQKRQE